MEGRGVEGEAELGLLGTRRGVGEVGVEGAGVGDGARLGGVGVGLGDREVTRISGDSLRGRGG